MAKYTNACGWITSVNNDLSWKIGELQNYVLGKYRHSDCPDEVIKAVEEAQKHMAKAQVLLMEASRTLIEADAAELKMEED